MKTMLTLCWSALLAGAVRADDVTKQDVIKLARAGCSDGLIITFLDSKGARLDPGADDVVEMIGAGVGEAVINFILKGAGVPLREPSRTVSPPLSPGADRYYGYTQPYAAAPRVVYTSPPPVLYVGASPSYYSWHRHHYAQQHHRPTYYQSPTYLHHTPHHQTHHPSGGHHGGHSGGHHGHH